MTNQPTPENIIQGFLPPNMPAHQSKSGRVHVRSGHNEYVATVSPQFVKGTAELAHIVFKNVRKNNQRIFDKVFITPDVTYYRVSDGIRPSEEDRKAVEDGFRPFCDTICKRLGIYTEDQS